MKLLISRATTPDDATQALEVLREVSQALAAQGQALWPSAMFSKAWGDAHLARNELVLGRVGDATAAVMLLMPQDQDYWPKAKPGEALYVHKLAVRRDFKGQGLAHRMIDWAKLEAARAGCAHLRLDTDRTRPALCQLYEGMGFVACGELNMNGLELCLYQCAVGSISQT